MDFKDYYRTLGVERTASHDQIKHAYRLLARRYHPDVNGTPEAKRYFVEINEAFEVLGDEARKAQYDAYDVDMQLGRRNAAAAAWETSTGARSSPDGSGDAQGDFFDMLFGRTPDADVESVLRLHPEFNGRGDDQQTPIFIDIADSIAGTTRQLKILTPETDAYGSMTVRERILDVRIPRGVIEGQSIRLRGLGGAGRGSGEPGDLLLEIRFKPDPLFRVAGADLYADVPLAPWEAALGASVRVPSPLGPVALDVPAGAQSGREIRIARYGLPAAMPGDLVAVLKIVLPAAESAEAQEFYRDMARRFPFDPRPGWPA